MVPAIYLPPGLLFSSLLFVLFLSIPFFQIGRPMIPVGGRSGVCTTFRRKKRSPSMSPEAPDRFLVLGLALDATRFYLVAGPPFNAFNDERPVGFWPETGK